MSENNTPQYDRLDSNGLLYFLQRIKTIFTGMFVSKETGKGLSTNDYTTAEKTKLGNIETGAQANVIEGVQRNGTDLTATNKKVNVEVPVLGVQRNGTDLTPNSTTKKVNVEVPVLGIQKNGTDLTPNSSTKKVNIEVPVVDSSLVENSTNPVQSKIIQNALALKAPLASPAFTGNPTVPTQATSDNSTKAASTAYVKAAIAAALEGKIDLQFSFLQELPASGVVGTFYFIPATNEEAGVDEWEEYVWNATDSQFERIGAATLDLTDYFNTTNLPAITNAQIETILATPDT